MEAEIICEGSNVQLKLERVTFVLQMNSTDSHKSPFVAVLGFRDNGTLVPFSFIPYQDDVFSTVAHWFIEKALTNVWVVIDGELQPVAARKLAPRRDTLVIKPVWCPVANMIFERRYGPGGAKTKSGSKHFSPGAKLYCLAVVGYHPEITVEVVGRHRSSHRYVSMIVSASWLVNWRVELAYSQVVIARLIPAWDGTLEAKDRAEVLASRLAVHIH